MKTTRITLTALGVLALAACGTQEAGSQGDKVEQASPDDLSGKTYAIDAVAGEAKAEKLMKGSKLTIEFAEKDKLRVGTDCNQFSGVVAFEGDTMAVSRLAGTQMACEGDANKQQQWATELLDSDPEWSVKDGKLLLDAEAGTVTFTETESKTEK